DIVIDGRAPAASSTLAVKFWATALVMQCTRGECARTRSMTSAQAAARSRMERRLSGSRISTPSAGMTRVRFDGLARASQSGPEHDPEKWVPVFGKRSCSKKGGHPTEIAVDT